MRMTTMLMRSSSRVVTISLVLRQRQTVILMTMKNLTCTGEQKKGQSHTASPLHILLLET